MFFVPMQIKWYNGTTVQWYKTIYEERQRRDAMPVDKQVLLRYQVLNKCFRNIYREYTIDDLVNECNKALRKADKPDVSKRTIQNDINILEADYGIMLQENLKQGKKRLYRYTDTAFPCPCSV